MLLNKIILPTFFPLYTGHSTVVPALKTFILSQLPALKTTFFSKTKVPRRDTIIIMRRASEAIHFFLGFPSKKKPLHNGSYEHRVPKIKNETFFCTRVCDSTS